MAKRKLVIVGTGLFGQVAKDYFNELSNYQVVAFACHERYRQADSIHGIPLCSVEKITLSYPPSEAAIFIAIGYTRMNKIRQATYGEIKAKGYTCPTFVHPNVRIWNSTTLGDNVFIFEDNTIQPYTKIGNNTILWSGNHVGHHSVVGENCFISSHVVISGSCKVGNNVFLGVNSTLHDGLTIGDECLIGAGAIISKSTRSKQVYAPAATKPFSKDSEELGF